MGLKLGISIVRNTSIRKQFKRIYEEKREVARGEWRKLHNEEINTFSFLQNIIIVIGLGRINCVGNVARREKLISKRNTSAE
jgi:hypothetical protein